MAGIKLSNPSYSNTIALIFMSILLSMKTIFFEENDQPSTVSLLFMGQIFWYVKFY